MYILVQQYSTMWLHFFYSKNRTRNTRPQALTCLLYVEIRALCIKYRVKYIMMYAYVPVPDHAIKKFDDRGALVGCPRPY